MNDLQQTCETLVRLWPDIFIRDSTGAVWIPNTNIGYWPESGDEIPLTSDDADAMLSKVGVQVYVVRPMNSATLYINIDMANGKTVAINTGILRLTLGAQRLAKIEGFKKAIQLLAQEKEKEK